MEKLVEELCQEYQNVKNLQKLSYMIENYKETNWGKDVEFCHYTFNKILLVRRHELEIYLICWRAGQSTKIHDHPEKGCLMKVLKGELTELLYDGTLKELNINILKEGDVSSRIGKEILHKIVANLDTCSLHVYSPPLYQPNYYELRMESK